MMLVVLLCLISYFEPADTNIYDGMDANIRQYSRYWEWVYETSPHGFRTSQGCLDMSGWYMDYYAKTEADFSNTFSLRYQFYMLRNYADTITDHRFEPTMRLFPNLYAHLVIVPYYKKNFNELGVGLSWRQGYKNWLALYFLSQRYDHNFSLMHTPRGPTNDPFEKIPLKLEVDGRWELDWLRVRLFGQLGLQSHQYLNWPDSAWEVWHHYQDSSGFWGRLEVRPIKNLWMGSRFNWRRERSETTWPARDSLVFDTFYNYWMEPFIAFFPNERLELRLEYRIWNIDRSMDSATYYSDCDILSTLISWQPVDWFLFEGGYQRSRRFRYNNDTTILEPYKGRAGKPQSRLIFNFEFRLRSGMMFTIKEGLEMDYFPRDLFRSPHNHTYVLLYLPLAVLNKDESEKSRIPAQSLSSIQ